jgi:hypothetical protein
VIAEDHVITDADILLEVLTSGEATITPDVARQILAMRFTEKQKARMETLADRNSSGTLTSQERQEMLSFANLGTTLSILHSKARLALRNVEPA